jgi:hypothetical protein
MIQQVVDLNPVEVPNRYEMPRFLPSGSFVRLLGVPVLITSLSAEHTVGFMKCENLYMSTFPLREWFYQIITHFY